MNLERLPQASVLERAGVVHLSCIHAANAAALGKKGWIAKDTTALGAAIVAVKHKEEGQERSRSSASARRMRAMRQPMNCMRRC